jgi:hypothetical protein
VTTNSAPINSTISNLNAASATINNLLVDMQAGKGLAGAVLTDPALAENLKSVAGNLSATSSNLNRFGLWHLLWKKHPPLTNAPAPAKQ